MSKVIGKIGSCENCEWREEDYTKDVQRLARQHTKKNNHSTTVEVVRAFFYLSNERRKG